MATNPNLTYGKVTGFYSRVFVDGVDADTEPETLPIAGLMILFTPSQFILVNPSAKATIQISPFPAITDDDGHLCSPLGERGIELPASIDPAINETGWTWNVSISGAGYPTETYAFTLTAGQEVDLSTLVKLPSSLGADIVQWEAAVAQALAGRDEAEQFAAAAAQEVATVPAKVAAAVTAANIPSLVAAQIAGQAGKVVTGSGAPNGSVTAAAGTLYADTVKTLGAAVWRKDSGVGNTGWLVVDGNTGPRNVGTDLGATGGVVQLTRTGGVCSLVFVDAVFGTIAGTYEPAHQWVGFRPRNNSNFVILVASAPVRAFVSRYGVRIQSMAAGAAVNGVMTWMADDGWPTSLPGSAG